MTPKFRVAICGGGIGGLAFAVILSRFAGPEIEVDVYEAAHEISTVGAGIALWPRTWQIFQELGLDKQLQAKLVEPPTWAESVVITIRRSDFRPGQAMGCVKAPVSATPFHRADVFEVLQNAIPPSCRVHTSKRLRTYKATDDGGYLLHFADGSTSACDVLVGADGLRSPIRWTLFERMARLGAFDPHFAKMLQEPGFLGVTMHRYLIPAEKLRAVAPNHPVFTQGLRVYLGKNHFLIGYQISQGKLINVGATFHIPSTDGQRYDGEWVAPSPSEEVINLFQGWDEEATAIIQCVESPNKWAVHAVRPLPTFVQGRVALIGDAAHGAMPTFGHGAGQALEDAYVLGRLLADPSTTLDRVPTVLGIYDAIRRPIAIAISQSARELGVVYHLNTPELCDGLENNDGEDRLARISAEINKRWAWQWEGKVGDEWERAHRLLKESLPKQLAKL